VVTIAVLVFLLTQLLATTWLTATGPRVHAPIIPIRNPQGRIVLSQSNQSYSANWSGYSEAAFETGLTYTGASGKWAVPLASALSGFSEAYSSAWVGIGGQCENASCTIVDSTLLQLGTESDVSSSGSGTYYAWYEALPQPPVTVPLTINPGDVIAAELAMTKQSSSQSQSWVLKMKNQTTGGSWSTTLSYQSFLLSAEWIVEAPIQGSSVLPLANYKIMKFDRSTINAGANPSLVAGEGIVMTNPAGMLSIPTGPDADTDGFHICWSPPTGTTPCSSSLTSTPTPPPPPRSGVATVNNQR
jgi:hypothetical protein